MHPLSIQVPSVTTTVTGYMFLMGSSILVRRGPIGNILSNTRTGDTSRIISNGGGRGRATRTVVWLVDAATSRRSLSVLEFNVARNWLKVGRPLDGPRPGAIGVKAHHVFQVVQVIDPGHVLAVSGNDYNAVSDPDTYNV